MIRIEGIPIVARRLSAKLKPTKDVKLHPGPATENAANGLPVPQQQSLPESKLMKNLSSYSPWLLLRVGRTPISGKKPCAWRRRGARSLGVPVRRERRECRVARPKVFLQMHYSNRGLE